MSLSRKLFFFISFISLLLGCRNTEKTSHPPHATQPISFYLDFDRLLVPTSDSLLSANQKASMLVTIYQDKEAKVLGFNINAFTIWQGEKLLYNYENDYELSQPKTIPEVIEKVHKKEFYPVEVQPYFLKLNNYLETLKFSTDSTVTPKEVNIASFVFRFSGQEKQTREPDG